MGKHLLSRKLFNCNTRSTPDVNRKRGVHLWRSKLSKEQWEKLQTYLKFARFKIILLLLCTTDLISVWSSSSFRLQWTICAYQIMHRVWRPIYGHLWRNAISDQCLHWKYFTFASNSRAEARAKFKKHLYFVKLIMRKVSNIPSENILADDPLPRMSRKGWIFDRRGGLSVHLFDQFILASATDERTTLVTLVSYKHNVAAKHGSSKPLTTN